MKYLREIRAGGSSLARPRADLLFFKLLLLFFCTTIIIDLFSLRYSWRGFSRIFLHCFSAELQVPKKSKHWQIFWRKVAHSCFFRRGWVVSGAEKGKMPKKRKDSRRDKRSGRQRSNSSGRASKTRSRKNPRTGQRQNNPGQTQRKGSTATRNLLRAPSAPQLRLAGDNPKISVHKYSPLEFAQSVVRMNPTTGILEQLEKFRKLRKTQSEAFHTTVSRHAFDSNKDKNRYPGTLGLHVHTEMPRVKAPGIIQNLVKDS